MPAKKSRKLNKGKIIGCVLFALSFVMVVSLLGRGIRIFQRTRELSAAKAQLALLQEECDDVQQELDLLDDENYVTRYARKNWVFTKEGETVIPLPEDATSSHEQ